MDDCPLHPFWTSIAPFYLGRRVACDECKEPVPTAAPYHLQLRRGIPKELLDRGSVPEHIASRPHRYRPFLNIPWNHPTLRFFKDHRIVYHLDQLRRYYQLPICVSTCQVILHNIRELNVRLGQLRLATRVWPTRERRFEPGARYRRKPNNYFDNVFEIPDDEIPAIYCLQPGVSTSFNAIPWARPLNPPPGRLIIRPSKHSCRTLLPPDDPDFIFDFTIPKPPKSNSVSSGPLSNPVSFPRSITSSECARQRQDDSSRLPIGSWEKMYRRRR